MPIRIACDAYNLPLPSLAATLRFASGGADRDRAADRVSGKLRDGARSPNWPARRSRIRAMPRRSSCRRTGWPRRVGEARPEWRVLALQGLQQAIVVGVTADPEPRNLVILEETEGTVAEGHTDGIDGFELVDPLELEARMRGVVPKESIGLSGRLWTSRGSSRYAAQKRGVAREFTTSRGRVRSFGQSRGRLELRRRVSSGPPGSR